MAIARCTRVPVVQHTCGAHIYIFFRFRSLVRTIWVPIYERQIDVCAYACAYMQRVYVCACMRARREYMYMCDREVVCVSDDLPTAVRVSR